MMHLNARRIIAEVGFILTCLFTSTAFAFYMDEPKKYEAKVTEQGKAPADEFLSFKPYEINSIMFKHSSGDENASEIKISMRYYFKRIKQDEAEPDALADIYGFNTFFSYTTKLDFYWLLKDTRPSGPVISRFHNPAMHFVTDTPNAKFWSSIDFGIEHISNGQALDVDNNQAMIATAYQSRNHVVMDNISRVGQTIGLTIEARPKLSLVNNDEMFFKLYAIRCGQEANVTWGPYANSGVNFNDFQLARIQWKAPIDHLLGTHKRAVFDAEMNIGRKGLAGDSWNFLLRMNPADVLWQIPLAISMHRGPMNNLSDYTQNQNTFAIGATFTY